MTNITQITPINDSADPSAFVIPKNHAVILGSMDERPDADLTLRRAVYYVDGGDGVADQLSICRKNIDGDAEWMPILMASLVVGVDASSTWTNLGAGPTSASPDDTVLVDVSEYSVVKMIAKISTPGSAGSTAYLEYTTDGSNWSTLTTNTIALDGSGYVSTDYETIPAGAKASIIQMRATAQGGDGVADPNIRVVTAQFRA